MFGFSFLTLFCWGFFYVCNVSGIVALAITVRYLRCHRLQQCLVSRDIICYLYMVFLIIIFYICQFLFSQSSFSVSVCLDTQLLLMINSMLGMQNHRERAGCFMYCTHAFSYWRSIILKNCNNRTEDEELKIKQSHRGDGESPSFTPS